MNIDRAYSLLEKIGFTRVSATKEELEAAKIIAAHIEEAGLKATIEEFEVNFHDINNVSLKDNYGTSYEVTGYGYAGNTPKEGITAPFYYMESFGDVDKAKAKDCIVLINGRIGYDSYETLVKCGVKGFITFGGDIIDKKEESDIDLRELRQPVLDLVDGVKLPGVHMRAKDAMDLVSSSPKEVTIVLEQKEYHQMSHNVICEIEGSEKKDEVIVYTAHYDSVHFSKGIYDNGAGSVIIYEMMHYFLENKPKRTVRFVWCGSEERGLFGSKAYVSKHQDELKNIVLDINVDVGGSVLGSEFAFVTADVSLQHYTDYLAKMNGRSIKVMQDIYSGDCMPFADAGVPAITFARFGGPGAAHIHDRHDTFFFVSKEGLKSTMDNVLLFSKEIVNCEFFPVPKKIPENVIEKVNKYLRKKVK